MDFLSKYKNNLLTIEDQEEALKDPCWSYLFAKANIPGSNFKTLQAKACEDPYYAFLFAKYIPGADINYCQEYACKNPYYDYMFAKYIPEADIKYCQEHACKDPYWALAFAAHIPDADIEFCFNKIHKSHPNWTFRFMCEVQGNFTNDMQMKMVKELYKFESFTFHNYKLYNKALKKITYSKAIEKLHKLRNMRKACE